MQRFDDTAALLPYSHLVPIGYSDSSHCGYCGRRRAGWSYYASSSHLTPEFYQKLLDRCWRRSGNLLYRPDQKHSCCPHYTLRLDSTRFKPSKDQRQTVNRFNKFILGEAYAKEAAKLYPLSREEAKKRDNDFHLAERVHQAEAPLVKKPPEPAHEFIVTLEPDTFTEEKYAIFENYQRVVHREGPEKISRTGFRRFLCESPLQRKYMLDENGNDRQLGSYHQCYRIDGRLVAIGVLDMLPSAVSAVYFFYHESFHSHKPGKLGALREIALAMEKGYQHWYPGFYIHSCPKMKYKMDYSPQYILDPETLKWDLVDKTVLDLLEKYPYVSLSRYREGLFGTKKDLGDQEDVEMKDPDALARSQGQEEQKEDDDNKGPNYGNFFLTSGMPGIPSLADMETVDLGRVLFWVDDSSDFFKASTLVTWDQCSIDDIERPKGKIAELVAALGPDLISEFCLDFTKRN